MVSGNCHFSYKIALFLDPRSHKFYPTGWIHGNTSSEASVELALEWRDWSCPGLSSPFFLFQQVYGQKKIIRRLFEDHRIRSRKNNPMTQMFTGWNRLTHLSPQSVFACQLDGHLCQPDRPTFEMVFLQRGHNKTD